MTFPAEGRTLPVRPLSEVLRLLEKLDHVSVPELRDLTLNLAIHVVQLATRVQRLENR